jgi:hypothetical protein
MLFSGFARLGQFAAAASRHVDLHRSQCRFNCSCGVQAISCARTPKWCAHCLLPIPEFLDGSLSQASPSTTDNACAPFLLFVVLSVHGIVEGSNNAGLLSRVVLSSGLLAPRNRAWTAKRRPQCSNSGNCCSSAQGLSAQMFHVSGLCFCL